MTDIDGYTLPIPLLGDIPAKKEENELAEMANEANYCKCPGAKTKDIIKKNNNKCPEPNCGLKLTDLPEYDDLDTNQNLDTDQTKIEPGLKILTEW